jgi:predicted deacetylase
LEAQLDMIKLPGWLEDAANLHALEAALERATPALLRPFEPLAGERDKSWWYKAAFMIAERAREALERAGHESVSSQKHGDFVIVVAAALKLATGKDFKPETVSGVLAKITD